MTLLLSAAVGLTGCWGDSSGPAPTPRQSVVSRFLVDQPGVLEMVIVDPLGARTARLVTADGTTIPAAPIDRDRNVYSDDDDGGPHFGVGAQGGSQGKVATGVGIEFPLLGGGGGGGTRTMAMTTSTITFRVPDMAAYRRDWQRWVLHVGLEDDGNRRVIETLPPRPPAE